MNRRAALRLWVTPEFAPPRNLAANSIEYFNLRSFDQELTRFHNIPTGPCRHYQNCGTTPTERQYRADRHFAGATYTIPRLTPFTLTAAASDPNGDALTYLWEEFDLNANGATGSVPNPNVPPVRRTINPNPTRNNTTLTGRERHDSPDFPRLQSDGFQFAHFSVACIYI